MPTDTTIIDRLRDEDACWSPQSGYDIAGMRALMRDAADALTAAYAARDAWRRAALQVGEDMATMTSTGCAFDATSPGRRRSSPMPKRTISVATARRRPCYRCGKRPGYATWNICADGNRNRVICGACDIALNRLVLRWLGRPGWQAQLSDYADRVHLAMELAAAIGRRCAAGKAQE